MPSEYSARSNQNILDICLNTYGDFKYLGKLLKDNGLRNALYNTSNNSKFVFDNSLITDVLVYNQGHIYATADTDDMNITDKTKSLEVLVGSDVPDGNTVTLSQLINAEVLLVFVGGTQLQSTGTEKYTFNKVTGTLDFTAVGGLSSVRLTVLYNEA